VVLSADVADPDQMQHAMEVVQHRWGGVTGVLHLAGITGESAMNLISDISTSEFERQFRPKMKGCESSKQQLRRWRRVSVFFSPLRPPS